MKINIVLGLGILLGLIGASLLVAFGILYVKPYLLVKDMQTTTCVTETSYPGDIMTCTCKNGAKSCRSKYPCLHILVNFTTDSGEEVVNSSLYDSMDTFQVQRDVKQCSIHTCGRSAQKNMDDVLRFHERYGSPGTEFNCFYAPNDVSYAIMDVVTVSTIIHCMLWPSVALVIGFIILTVYVCDVDVTRRKRRQQRSHVSSLERPWAKQESQYERVRV